MIHQIASTSPVALEHSVTQSSCEDLALAAEYQQLRSGLQALRKGCEGAARRLEQAALASDKAGTSQQQQQLAAARERAVMELAAARARAATEASMASEVTSLRTELVQERAEYSAMAADAAIARARELACREEMQAERLLLRTELEEASSTTCFLRDALEVQISKHEGLLVTSHETHAAIVAGHKAEVESLHRHLSETAARADKAMQPTAVESTVVAQTQTVEAALTERGSLAGRAWRQRRQDTIKQAPTEECSAVVPCCCPEQDLEVQLLPRDRVPGLTCCRHCLHL